MVIKITAFFQIQDRIPPKNPKIINKTMHKISPITWQHGIGKCVGWLAEDF